MRAVQAEAPSPNPLPEGEGSAAVEAERLTKHYPVAGAGWFGRGSA
ncbi:MAG TPA: hypothetical protein VE650_09935 [Acetobacteraceae bacterium]|nr:hypothetical protein [Acetobacteraceae bacterium]